MSLLTHLFKKRNPQAAKQMQPIPQGPHWSVSYTYGAHLYRREDEDSTVYFRYPERGVEKKIVDKTGHFLNFPGIDPDTVRKLEGIIKPNALNPQIRFRTEFGCDESGAFRILWQVQPDGRYWADEDGFGWENDEEILLCAFVDINGNFTGPFKLYQMA